MADRLYVIAAAPRSGTTVLGTAIARSYGVGYLGEVFHDENAGPGFIDDDSDFRRHTNFFNYRARRFRDDLSLAFPAKATQNELFEGYVRSLLDFYPDRNAVLIDVKYNSFFHLETYWTDLYFPPKMVDLFIAHDIGVIHVTRKNLFLQYLSLKRAEATGLWSTMSDLEADGRKLRLDPEACLKNVGLMARRVDQFNKWLFNTRQVRISYEDMFPADGSAFTPAVCEAVAELFGEPERDMVPEFRKIITRPGALIENADELLETFGKTDFAWMVEEAFAGVAGDD